MRELNGELTLVLGMRSICSRLMSTCAGAVGSSSRPFTVTCVCTTPVANLKSRRSGTPEYVTSWDTEAKLGASAEIR